METEYSAEIPEEDVDPPDPTSADYEADARTKVKAFVAELQDHLEEAKNSCDLIWKLHDLKSALLRTEARIEEAIFWSTKIVDGD